jgi:hypothetical protein
VTRRPSITAARGLLVVLVAAWPCVPAGAWPAELRERVARDARRLVPRTLAQLLGQLENEIREEAERLPGPLSQALIDDLSQGLLRRETLDAFQAYGAEAPRLMKQRHTRQGLVRLGALMRVPADLADPIVTAGPPNLAPGLAREYYAFVESSLRRLPVTLDDPAALELTRADLPAYLARVQAQSRAQADILRREMLRQGRVVPHASIDYRSPVFAVAQISWSRAATAVAATWLATWREARGDLTRRPSPRELAPSDRGPSPRATPPEESRP